MTSPIFDTLSAERETTPVFESLSRGPARSGWAFEPSTPSTARDASFVRDAVTAVASRPLRAEPR